MKKLDLEIIINAPREKVWDAVVNEQKYRQWTKVFEPTSHFEGGWNKGDRIRFLGINKEGKKEGMISEIAESRFPEHISIKHLGMISDGVEDTTSEAVRKWAPSFENYTMERMDDQTTRFRMDMDIAEEYYDMFLDLWPKALGKLKEVSEQ